MKNVSVMLVLGGLLLVLLFWGMMLVFRSSDYLHEKDIYFARKVLGKGFKVALSGQDWNNNNIPETISYSPQKIMKTSLPNYACFKKLVIIENEKVLWEWTPMKDTLALIPVINNIQQSYISFYFSTDTKPLNLNSQLELRYKENRFILEEKWTN